MLGQVLSGFNGDNKTKGYSEGIKARVGLSTIDKNNAEAQLKQQQLDAGSDDNLISSVLSKIGANSQGGKDDLLATMAGTYKPLAGPPTEAQDRGGALAVPPPSYLSKLPQAADQYSKLKQMLALGDPNYAHMSEAQGNEQKQALISSINPSNVAEVANNFAAQNGNIKDILAAQFAKGIANDGMPKANERGAYSLNGKTEFSNMGSEGVMSNATGATTTTPVGQSVIYKNMEAKDAKEQTAPSGYRNNADGTQSFIKGGPADPALDVIKLKQIPSSISTAIVNNNQSLSKLDAAIALFEGKNVGEGDGMMLGDKEASGLKGYLPQAMLNRLDPKGVDARASAADIGSLILHDRSGAAVTASESPRLLPFIPTNTDDNATILKKLKRLREYQRTETDLLSSQYNGETGYRTSNASAAKTAPTASTKAASNPSQGLSFTMPNGKKFNFKDQKSMDSFKREAGVK